MAAFMMFPWLAFSYVICDAVLVPGLGN